MPRISKVCFTKGELLHEVVSGSSLEVIKGGWTDVGMDGRVWEYWRRLLPRVGFWALPPGLWLVRFWQLSLVDGIKLHRNLQLCAMWQICLWQKGERAVVLL